jgi:hypothetical protein
MVLSYPVDLICPRCGCIGEGDASESLGDRVNRYTILPMSGDFRLVHSSDQPGTAIIACECGVEFYA